MSSTGLRPASFGSVEEAEVAVGVVGELPIKVADDDVREHPRVFDLLAVVGQLSWTGPGRILRQALSDLVIDLPQLGEAGVAVLREDVDGATVARRPPGRSSRHACL
jgi:hypothetical protein